MEILPASKSPLFTTTGILQTREAVHLKKRLSATEWGASFPLRCTWSIQPAKGLIATPHPTLATDSIRAERESAFQKVPPRRVFIRPCNKCLPDSEGASLELCRPDVHSHH